MKFWCRQGYLADWEEYEAESGRHAAELHAAVLYDRDPRNFVVIMVCRDEIREYGPTPTLVYEVDQIARPIFVAKEVIP